MDRINAASDVVLISPPAREGEKGMKKKQTYVSYIENADGKMTDFNRWTYKRPETIVKKHKEALEQDRTFWRKIWRDGVTLAIYATPDGYNKEPQPVITISLDELEPQAV